MKLIYFYTPQCEPCKTFGPIAEDLAREYRIKFEKYSANQATKLAAAYQVTSVPKLVAVDDAGQCFGAVGMVSARKLRTWVERVMERGKG